MARQPSRREFLVGSAALAAGFALGGQASAQNPRRGDKIRFAVVGVGGRGSANLASAAKHGVIAALCDIDVERRSKALSEFPDAATFEDFRRMLDGMGDQIDAVVISTPDHTHAPAAAMAMNLGKHVYVEKPLTRTIGEARKLTEIARAKRVVTQMGNQGTASPELRKAAAHLQAGTFGAVKEIHCWTNRAGGWWPQGVPRPEPALTPKGIDFDLWLGPSPNRPYAPGYHPFAWRGWWDFGSGALGDIGCHCMNLPFMGVDLRDPSAVQAQTSGHNRDSFPTWSIVTYDFPARGRRAPLKLTWYDGGKLPSLDLAPGVEKLADNGCLIVCENATIYSQGEYGGNNQLLGRGEIPPIAFEESPGHFTEFANAIQGRGETRSNIQDYSGALSETVLLGNLAVWADGPRLEWDPRRLTVRGNPEYDRLIHPPYRSAWRF